MPREKTDGLPQYLYARGPRLWMRYQDEKGKWRRKRTRYLVDQVEEAERYVQASMRVIEDQRKQRPADGPGEMTFGTYAEAWHKERRERDLPGALDDRSRLDHALPHLGHLLLREINPVHIRDMVRALRKGSRRRKRTKKPPGEESHASSISGTISPPDRLAPRTVRHVFMLVHNIFENAIVEQLTTGITSNPVKVKKDELPKKVDADPEWRAQATYTVREVERLISDPLIPPERRVQYAFKALAGMRHGEVAAICWRHIDHTMEPLAKINVVQSFNSRLGKIKSTKTEETRAIPLHPTLAKVVAAWKLMHWERIYGRPPKDDDFVVPTRTMRPVAAKDAIDALKRDLKALEMRVEAGRRRDRGGHDLRSFYETRLIEDGADSLIVRRTTHAPPTDVNGGYERFSWATICREIAKLKVSLLPGDVLELGTHSEHAETKARNRWRKVVTPMGLEPMFSA